MVEASFLVMILAMVVGCILFGLSVIRLAAEISPPPPLPPAQIANASGRVAVYASASRAAGSLGVIVRRRALQLVGVGFIALPLLAVCWLLLVLAGGDAY